MLVQNVSKIRVGCHRPTRSLLITNDCSMAFKIFSYLKDFSLVFLSSFLFVLSFPTFDLGFLAWVGLLPLFIAIKGKSLKYSFLLSFVCGFLFFVGIFHWILQVPKYTLLHHALLGVHLGSYFGFFGLSFNFISTRWGIIPALFSSPFIWVSLEFIRSNLSFLALPWTLIAHSQHQYPTIIQIVSLSGTYGLSFLIVMVNSGLTSLVWPLVHHPHPHPPPSKGEGMGRSFASFASKVGGGKRPSSSLSLLITTASLVILTLLYGYLIISQPISGNRIKVSLVQGNIEQIKKWDPRYAREIMQIYAELTQEATKDQPALIVWPETATPGSINQDFRLHMEVINIARKAGTYLLLGSAQHQKFTEKVTRGFKYLNSAFLIDPGTKLVRRQRYDKVRLFPFGEYLPYKEVIPWSYINVRESSGYVAGKEYTVFNHPDFRFGVTICWENVFPDLFRQFVKSGAQLMINITNEAHFGKTAASHQLASMSVFRAVENRIYVVRCANTGVSCIIDPYGRIIDRVKDEKGQDIFIRGVMSGWVIPLDSKTIYTRYGDWFVWVAMIGSIMFLTVAALKGGKR